MGGCVFNPSQQYHFEALYHHLIYQSVFRMLGSWSLS